MAQTLFKHHGNEMAYLKAGFMGFSGSGKTHTASALMIGLVRRMREMKMALGDKPVYFLDTETGSDWVRPLFASAGIELRAAKTRTFKDLTGAISEAERDASGLILDSVTHYWRDLTESYAKKKNRHRLAFEDWAWLKQEWGKFTDSFVNSWLHIIMCGRAGYEYDFFLNEDTGKKELEKTGIKMKAETETGFEPSLLVLMERQMNMADRSVYREAHILKDRSRLIDGKTFEFTKDSTIEETFECFLPHIEFLKLGGEHLGVDTSADSTSIIPTDSERGWKYAQEQKEIYLDKIKAVFVEAGLDGNSAEAKRLRIEGLKLHFDTNSWVEIETKFSLDRVIEGHDKLYHSIFKEWPAGSKYAPAPEPTPEGRDETKDIGVDPEFVAQMEAGAPEKAQ